MVFPGLLSAGDMTTANRSKTNAAAEVELLPEFIYDEYQLPCAPPPAPTASRMIPIEVLATAV